MRETFLQEEFYFILLDLLPRHISLVLFLLLPRILSRSLLSIIGLESILQIHKEKFLTPQHQGRLKITFGDAATTLAADIDKTTKIIEVANASGLSANTYIDIDEEQIFIKSITGNKLTVRRGEDRTTITDHVNGASVFVIDSADSAQIEVGDDFGFSGSYF